MATTIIPSENRLGKILGGPDARPIDEIVAAADMRVAALENTIREYCAQQIAEILKIHRKGEVAIFTESQTLSRLAMNIAEVAGAAGMGAMGEAARGVCAMLEALVTDGLWHSDALELHISSLMLISGSHAPDETETLKIIDRLKAMRASIGVPE